MIATTSFSLISGNLNNKKLENEFFNDNEIIQTVISEGFDDDEDEEISSKRKYRKNLPPTLQ